jgi:hypothetical protein
MSSDMPGSKGLRHLDRSGHFQRGYIAVQRAHAAELGAEPDARAFLVNPNDTTDLAQESGAQFLEHITRANTERPDTAEQVVAEEMRAPIAQAGPETESESSRATHAREDSG